MKKVLMTILIVLGVALMAACGKQGESFSFGKGAALESAKFYVSKSGSMDKIIEVKDSFTYETKDGAKGVIFEVRLGSETMTQSNTDFIKVWKNTKTSKVQANWSSEKELAKKKTEYAKTKNKKEEA